MQELQTIRGYIRSLPRTPGKEDRVKATLIAEDGTAYHILHKGAGMDLADFAGADVEVTGTVSRISESDPAFGEEAADEEGSAFLLAVRGYRLTDGYDDPWYDDEV